MLEELLGNDGVAGPEPPAFGPGPGPGAARGIGTVCTARVGLID